MKLTKLIPSGLLFVLMIMSMATNVHAQTTSISNFIAPASVKLANGATVTFTVTYSTGHSGYNLLIFVRERNTTTYATGTGHASPDTCESQAGTPNPNSAICFFQPMSSSGSESMTFQLTFYSPRVYDLSAIAIIADSSGRVLMESESRQDFSINVSHSLSLRVQAEYPVVVTVDGVPQSPGPVFMDVSPGSHTISVPSLVDVDTGVRLRFDHWSDGTTSTTETFSLTDDASYTAVYVRQYKLTLATSQGVASGDEWVDEGSAASFHVSPAVPMTGILGILGGKFDFQGWYEEGTLVTSQSDGSLTMNAQHTLTANWTPNYDVPMAFLGVVLGIAAVFLTYYSTRKRAASQKTKT